MHRLDIIDGEMPHQKNIHVYVYIYIYIHIYIHVYIYIYIPVRIYTNVHNCA